MRIIILLLSIFLMNGVYAMNLTSTAFKDGGTIPVKYTCDSQDSSPSVAWTGAPANTQSFAIICADPDAPVGTWYHWVIYNIPSTITSLAENQTPTGSVLGKNSWGREKYNGPCPPKGNPHHYIFTLYALDTKLDLSSTDAPTLENSMKGHVLQSTTLTGLYGRK